MDLCVKNPLEHGVCPNPLCKWHHKANLPKGDKWYKSHGYYDSKQHGRVPRYACMNCGRTFTLRTGANYWHLKDDTPDLKELGAQRANGSTICELSQKYGVSEQMVRTRLKRYSDYSKSHWEGGLNID